jgi:uncharacterized coiled-coil protein SlyX
MAGRILIIVFALVAGAAGAFGYEFVSENVLASPQEEDTRIADMESRLAAMTMRLQELDSSQQEVNPDMDVLAARLNTLEERLSGLHEQQAKAQPAASAALTGSMQEGFEGEAAGQQDGPPAMTTRRISGEDLAAALKDLPEEGREMIRKAINQEVMRIKKEHDVQKDPRKKMEREVGKVVKELTRALELAPVQVEQMRAIGARHIDRMVEVAQVAQERDDPEYAQKMKKEIETQTKREIVDVVTPEQLDKLRELDPDGIGKEYPRGF